MHGTRNGYVVLVGVVIVGAMAALVAAAMLALSSGAIRARQARLQGTVARMSADACAEEALQKIKESASFTGTGSLALASTTCGYAVTGASVPKTVTASSTYAGAVRRVTVTVTATSPRVTLSAWSEIAN